MRKRKSEGVYLGTILKKIAPKIGAKVVMEPDWNIAGQIVFKNGRKRYFRYSSLDLNPLGASEVAADKGYAYFFMAQMGYPTIPGQNFFSDRWCAAIGSRRDVHAAYRYVVRLGFPVIVKPNSGSRGVGVFKAHTKGEFYKAMRAVFVHDKVALVERVAPGKDYRIVVLDNKVISAYERIPLNVIGDGKAAISALLARKQRSFVAVGRDTNIEMDDVRILQNLKRQKLTMRSVLPRGEKLYLLDNANLSCGGDPVDVTNKIHPGLQEIAIRLTRDMGLRLCGVDLLVEGGIDKKPKKYFVLEVNAAPGLDHYVKSGKAQQKIVEDLYLSVLKAMQK